MRATGLGAAAGVLCALAVVASADTQQLILTNLGPGHFTVRDADGCYPRVLEPGGPAHNSRFVDVLCGHSATLVNCDDDTNTTVSLDPGDATAHSMCIDLSTTALLQLPYHGTQQDVLDYCRTVASVDAAARPRDRDPAFHSALVVGTLTLTAFVVVLVGAMYYQRRVSEKAY
jgi:hypothetical protein